MSASPHSPQKQPIKSKAPSTEPVSGATVILMTALDTTWRMFVPTIGGTLLGIWLDSLLNSAPTALIICLTVGAVTSFGLVAYQLINVRK